MHKTMSRIVVLLLVTCLALGNVVPALAADDTGSAGAVTPAAETSPAATAEATATPAATPAAETTAGTEATPTAAPTPTAETTETPATEEPIYSDGYYIGDSPLGPFSYAPNSPFSMRLGGFIQGAGHGSTIADKFGNLWHAATMCVWSPSTRVCRIGLPWTHSTKTASHRALFLQWAARTAAL